jgi:hypothetical protein
MFSDPCGYESCIAMALTSFYWRIYFTELEFSSVPHLHPGIHGMMTEREVMSTEDLREASFCGLGFCGVFLAHDGGRAGFLMVGESGGWWGRDGGKGVFGRVFGWGIWFSLRGTRVSEEWEREKWGF